MFGKMAELKRQLGFVKDDVGDLASQLDNVIALHAQRACKAETSSYAVRYQALEWAKKLNSGGTTKDILADAADVLAFLEGGDG